MVFLIRKILGKYLGLKYIKEKCLYALRLKYIPVLRRHIPPYCSIITNNCFGGRIPQDLGYTYNSPTAGLFFPYPDYITFLKHLPKYLRAQIKFKQTSNHHNIQGYLDTLPYHVPVGYLEVEDNEIEIIFLHYHTDEEAKEKWQRRCERVNLSHLIIFGSDNDECTKEDIIDFLRLPFKEKFFFSAHDYGIKDSNEYCTVKEMLKDGEINSYDRAHILYRYLCNLKYSE